MLDIIKGIKNDTRVYFDPSKAKELSGFLKKHPDTTLIIETLRFDKSRKPISIDNLDSLRGLKFKSILIIGHGINNFDGLTSQADLIDLDAEIVLDLKYDFSYNRKLKKLSITWTKDIKNIEKLTNLEIFKVHKYVSKKDNPELSELTESKKLKELYLIQSKLNDISLVARLKKLKHLSLVYCPNIDFREGKTKSFPNIQSLYIEKCRAIDVSFVKLFPNLQTLTLQNQPPIETLKPILSKLKKLKTLSINGTKILEADNRYWKEFRNIKELSFYEMRHHMLKNADF